MDSRERPSLQLENSVVEVHKADSSALETATKALESLDITAADIKEEDSKEPALIDVVIRTLGRINVFGKESFKALRATCRAFRDLVDEAKLEPALNANGRISFSNAGLLLEAWARGGRLFRQTCSITVHLEPDLLVIGRCIVALSTQKPPIRKIALDDVGESGNLLLAAPLEHLHELSITWVRNAAEFARIIVMNRFIVDLRTLRIFHMRVANAASLADVLAHLTQLRRLSLAHVDVEGKAPPPHILRNSLTLLESLEVTFGNNFENAGLFGSAGPILPSLRNVELSYLKCSVEGSCWLSQVTSLSLENANTRGIEAGLNGGLLKNFRGEFGSFAPAQWNWEGLELNHLTFLVFDSHAADVLGDIARAKLPMLHTASLPFTSSTTAKATADFGIAFPHLRVLTLRGSSPDDPISECRPPSMEAVRALSRDVVPLLESFTFQANINASEIEQNLLPTEPAQGAPAWPRLQQLSLKWHFTADSAESRDQLQLAIKRSAPHLPSMKAIYVSSFW